MKLFRYGYTKDGNKNHITIAVDYQWQADLYFKKHFPDAVIDKMTVEEMLYGRSDVNRDFSKLSYNHGGEWESKIYNSDRYEVAKIGFGVLNAVIFSKT